MQYEVGQKMTMLDGRGKITGVSTITRVTKSGFYLENGTRWTAHGVRYGHASSWVSPNARPFQDSDQARLDQDRIERALNELGRRLMFRSRVYASFTEESRDDRVEMASILKTLLESERVLAKKYDARKKPLES